MNRVLHNRHAHGKRGHGTLAMVGVLLTLVCLATTAPAADELATRATWSQPTAEQVRGQLNEYLDARQVEPAVREQIDLLWGDDADDEAATLDRLVDSLALVDEQVQQVVAACRDELQPGPVPRFDILSDEKQPPLVRNNLRLIFGRWLVSHHLFNDALEWIEPLTVDDVADPASLLFYQAIAHHRLMHKEMCLPLATRLLENETTLPRRYAALARLLEADLKPLEIDSLDEVARLMDNIRVRLDQGRAGARVRKEEEDVVAKLEKLIEELEKQRQQQQGNSGGSNPSSPMQDSAPGGGGGPGHVTPKRLAHKADWGNLPPKERQEALQQISKEFPSHYRQVVEQYFRKLARDGAGD